MTWFPLTDPLIGAPYGFPSRSLSVDSIEEHLWPRLTEPRRGRIETVVEGRTLHVMPVVEGLYDRGNISAVMRSAEAFGFLGFHIIETSERFKEANRVTRGAEKWLCTDKSLSTASAVETLRSRGYRIYATHLDASAKPLLSVDLSKPFALVFGNEKDGISKEMAKSADERVILPMQGFVQSFNISVAAAVAFSMVNQAAGRSFGSLSSVQRRILRAHYTLCTLENPVPVLDRLIES